MKEDKRAVQREKDAQRVKAGRPVIPIFFGLLSLPFLAISMYAFLFIALIAGFAFWRHNGKVKRYKRHEGALSKLTRFEDIGLLRFLQTSISEMNKSAWEGRHRFIYGALFDSALENEMDSEQMSWLKRVSAVLGVDARSIHEARIKERIWQSMADGSVAENEIAVINELLEICEMPADRFRAEASAFHQFIAARRLKEGTLPRVADIHLPEDELCHHQTSGSLLEKQTVRTGAARGEHPETEGLTVSAEGKIYITSKRILIVGDGTTSIPHEKTVDAVIDPDNDIIEVTKGGKQHPIFLRVPDLIYTGILLEAASRLMSVNRSIMN